jgi:hypothetical protein
MADLWDQRRKEHEQTEEAERQRQARLFGSAAPSSGPPLASGERPARGRPLLASIVLGTCGGIGGVVVGAILSSILGPLVGDVFAGHELPSDYFEAMGYTIGLYCVVMVPCGSILVGGLPGMLVARLRLAQGKPQASAPSLFAGFVSGLVATLILTLGFLAIS